jgi:DNA-binding XRE family transcriptional regulator
MGFFLGREIWKNIMTQEEAVDLIFAAACTANSIPEERVRPMFELACMLIRLNGHDVGHIITLAEGRASKMPHNN